MDLLQRTKDIMLRPRETWLEIRDEATTIPDLFKSYAAVLAAIPAVGHLIGNLLVGYSFMGGHFRMGFGRALGGAVVSYVLSLVGVYIVAMVTDWLAPTFSSERGMLNALKAVVYSMTPSWMAGILYVVPVLSPLSILAAIYGVYLFYTGLPVLMRTPPQKTVMYLVAVVVVSVVLSLIIGALSFAVLGVG